jgi:hypothetical protein
MSRLPGARVFQNVPLEERYIKLRLKSGDPLTVLGVLQNSGVERLSALSRQTVGLLVRVAQCDPQWKVYRKVSYLGFLLPFVETFQYYV